MGSKVALGNPNLQINLIITQSGNNSAHRERHGNTQLYFVESSGERVLAPPITPVRLRGSLEQSLFSTLGN